MLTFHDSAIGFDFISMLGLRIRVYFTYFPF